jgi:hypothetical protein
MDLPDVRVQCRVSGRVFRLPPGTLILPTHAHRDYPEVRCTGSGTAGAPVPSGA